MTAKQAYEVGCTNEWGRCSGLDWLEDRAANMDLLIKGAQLAVDAFTEYHDNSHGDGLYYDRLLKQMVALKVFLTRLCEGEF
jgi:hypothetical protein